MANDLLNKDLLNPTVHACVLYIQFQEFVWIEHLKTVMLIK